MKSPRPAVQSRAVAVAAAVAHRCVLSHAAGPRPHSAIHKPRWPMVKQKRLRGREQQFSHSWLVPVKVTWLDLVQGRERERKKGWEGGGEGCWSSYGASLIWAFIMSQTRHGLPLAGTRIIATTPTKATETHSSSLSLPSLHMFVHSPGAVRSSLFPAGPTPYLPT